MIVKIAVSQLAPNHRNEANVRNWARRRVDPTRLRGNAFSEVSFIHALGVSRHSWKQ